MKAFIVHHAFKHISIYNTYLVTCTYETRFQQFQENIFVSRKNKIYNRNKIQCKNKIHDVEMKSTTADRKGDRRKMSQDSVIINVLSLRCASEVAILKFRAVSITHRTFYLIKSNRSSLLS